MSTVVEIEDAIERLPPGQMREIAMWLVAKMVPDESDAMLAALDAGIESLQREPVIPAEAIRNRIKEWATG
ncbi:hypothetical protein OpiT1DRAFT_02797 [Opitutaceae bacterium TAV1]|nr:hypothetical protein OpiT1DRAFT_02797 [Opitutaceae bacterium TAV1]